MDIPLIRTATVAGQALGLACVVLWLASPQPAHAAGLSLGDAQTTTGKPARGELRTCAPTRNRTGGRLPWTSKGRWFPRRRPVIDGKITWPEGEFTINATGDGELSLRTRSVPESGTTGAWPVKRSDDAFAGTPKNRAIAPYDITGRLPKRKRTRRSFCIDLDEPIGMARGGVPILAPTNGRGTDVAAREVTDRCGGVVSKKGLYAYRTIVKCLPREARRKHSAQIGWARDGFLLFGPRGRGGAKLRNADLDRCHGHVHRITVGDRQVRRYHYHQTSQFPYLVGCFRGKPAKWKRSADPLPAKTSIQAGPGQIPEAFAADVTDYALRCTGDPVSVEATGGRGEVIRVDGSKQLAGHFARGVALTYNQSFSITNSTTAGERDYHYRCVYEDFPVWEYERTGQPRNAFYAISRAGYILFDDHGVPVWWYEPGDVGVIDAAVQPGGLISYARNDESGYDIRRLDGTLVRRIAYVGRPTDSHDLQFQPNGNALVISYPQRDNVDLTAYGRGSSETVVDAEIQEIAPNGDVAWVWNSSDHIGLDEVGRWFDQPFLDNSPYDVSHINSVEPAGDSVIISLRHTDAVYSISRATGEVEWKLGGETTPESLTVVGDHLGDYPLGGQHDARVLTDGTLTAHDNGTGLDRPPRAVRFTIDETARTATFVEEVTDPRAPASGCCGGARRSDDGSWVMSWGSLPYITEFDPAGNRTFFLDVSPRFSYRANPVPFGEIRIEDLRAGMEAQHPRD